MPQQAHSSEVILAPSTVAGTGPWQQIEPILKLKIAHDQLTVVVVADALCGTGNIDPFCSAGIMKYRSLSPNISRQNWAYRSGSFET
jgi:hypothetical protein